MTQPYILHGGRGTGAVAVEAALTLMGLPYRLIDAPEVDTHAGVEPRTPMGQVPSLTLPTGESMTESAAILIRLTELHPDAGLAPPVDAPERSAFLRWMSFVSSAIYAHYWAKDDPLRLVDDPAQIPVVEARLAERIAWCWSRMESETSPAPWILGERLTVLDLYVTVVSRFRPGRVRLRQVAPRLNAVCERLDAERRLADLWARRYPFEAGWDRA